MAINLSDIETIQVSLYFGILNVAGNIWLYIISSCILLILNTLLAFFNAVLGCPLKLDSSKLWKKSCKSAALVVSLMVLISYVFGKVYERQFAPVKDITNCLKEISLGNYDTKLKVKAEGEFRELADVTKNLINHLNATQIILDKENKRLNEQIRLINELLHSQ